MLARLMGLNVVSPRELQLLLQGGRALAIDVNSQHGGRHARVPGALALDFADFTSGELPEDRDRTLVFYCSNPFCRKAPSAAKRAAKMGWTDVRVMSAGIAGWMNAGLPTDSDEYIGQEN